MTSTLKRIPTVPHPARSRSRRKGGGPYFDDARADNGLAFVSGLDIAAAVTPQVAIVPTLRVYVVDRGAPPAFGNTASAGPVLVHGGAGVRIRF